MSKEICRLEEGHNLFPLEYRLSAGKPFPQKPRKCCLPKTQASWWCHLRSTCVWSQSVPLQSMILRDPKQPRQYQLFLKTTWGPRCLRWERVLRIQMRGVKGDCNWMVFWNNRTKGWRRVGAWTGTFKPYQMPMALEPLMTNFFSPPAHLCAVTCISEKSMIVMLSNQYSLTPPHY